MKRRLSIIVAGFIFIICGTRVDAETAQAPRVWLSGLDPVVIHDRNPRAAVNDFMYLFQADAPWKKTAAKVQVFKLSTQFLHRASDADLSAVIHGLKARHIALGLEAESLAASVRCGNGIPGFTAPGLLAKVAARVHRLGGQIDMVAFDEPLAFGHYYHKRRNACAYSIEDTVRNMAPGMQALKAAFPAIQFGDIEPVTDITADRLEGILTFARTFEAVTGSRLSFVHADIIWQNRWQPQLVAWRSRLHEAGIRFGVIFDGEPTDKSDEIWTGHAIERYRLVAANPAMLPDDVIFQSWQDRPARYLPEDRPGTLTSVLLQYVSSR